MYIHLLGSDPPLDTDSFIHPSADPLLIARGRRMLDWLYELPDHATNRFITGQYRINQIRTIQEETGIWVGMFQRRILNAEDGPYLSWGEDPKNYVDYYNAGGLVHENPCFGNPAAKSKSRDRAFTAANMTALMTPGTTVYNNFMDALNPYCDKLRVVANNNVPILFRPFHEMNGAIYWWNTPGASAFKDLWAWFFDEMTKRRGFHNLLWCYAPTRYAGNFLTWYPNPNTVDIAGMDFYWDVATSGPYTSSLFTPLNSYLTSTGKPFMMLEFGGKQAPPSAGKANYTTWLPAIKNWCPRCIGACNWSTEWSLMGAYATGVSAYLTDSWACNRSDIPNFGT